METLVYVPTATLIPWLDTGPKLQSAETGLDLLVFDLAESEGHQHSMRIPEHPVEQSADVTDDITRELSELTLEVMITDTPLDALIPEPDRARRRYEDLKSLMEAGTVLRVVTGLDVYPTMVIKDLNVTRDAATGYAVRASVTLREVRFVTRVYVQVPDKILRATVKNKGKGEADQGLQGTDDMGLGETCPALEEALALHHIDAARWPTSSLLTLWCYDCPGGRVGTGRWEDCPPASPRYRDKRSL